VYKTGFREDIVGGEKKLKQLNMLVLIIVGVSMLLMIILAFFMKPDNQKKIQGGKLTEFNSNWVIANYQDDASAVVNLPLKMDAPVGETVLLMHVVPENMTNDSVIAFQTEFQNVQVYIGDTMVYENGVMNNQKLMKNAVPCLNVVPLSGASAGDVISIYIQSGYKKYSGKLNSIYYGTSGDVSSWIIEQNGMAFVFSIVLLVVVILLGISLIVANDVKVDKRKSGYAFGFVLAVVLWSIFNNPMMQLVTKNTFGVYMTAMILLLVMPVLYLMYRRCGTTKKRFAQIYEIAIYVFGVNLLTGVVFQLLDVCDFATYVVFVKVLIVLALIGLTGIMYLSDEAVTENGVSVEFVANVVLTAGSLLEALLSIFKFYSSYDGIVLQISLYIFLVMLVVSVEKGIISEMSQSAEIAINEISQEKDMAVKNINTALIFKALAQAAGRLKANNMPEGKLVYDTSVYMKCNLRAATDRQLVPFKEELDYIRAYLGIQTKRFKDLDVTVEDKISNFKVPYNTIEPLVENSVENGALKSASAGRFVLRSYERLDCYAVQIVDNGPGISPDKEFCGNVDYKTVKKRLKSECQAVVDVKCRSGKGMIITVKIPKDGYVIKE
jgi:hypothetical protein